MFARCALLVLYLSLAYPAWAAEPPSLHKQLDDLCNMVVLRGMMVAGRAHELTEAQALVRLRQTDPKFAALQPFYLKLVPFVYARQWMTKTALSATLYEACRTDMEQQLQEHFAIGPRR